MPKMSHVKKIYKKTFSYQCKDPLLFLVIPRSSKTGIQNIATYKPFTSYFTFTFLTRGCDT